MLNFIPLLQFFTSSRVVVFPQVLSKLACGINKPKKQTILPMTSVHDLFGTLPIRKVRHLGGKLGKSLIEEHGLNNMADICAFSRSVRLPLNLLCLESRCPISQ